MNIRRKLAGLSAFAILTSSLTTPLAGAISFADTTGHWGESSIDRWSDYGIVQGFGDGGFQPDGTMTRAQMATVLSNMLGLEATTDNRFTDVPDTAWFKDAILKCVKAGIMNGRTATTADPNGNIKREEATAMLARALKIAEKDGSTGFSDEGSISGYATGYVKALVDRKVIQGVGNNMFAPKANITRAAVTAILDRAIPAYTNKDGDSLTASSSGITLVAAKDVTVTGTATDVLIAPSAKGTTKLNGAKVSGTLSMDAAGGTLELDSASDVASIVVPEGADSATINVAGGSKLDKFATDAKDTTLNIKGSSSVGDIEIGEPAENTVINIENGSTVSNITSAADNVAVKGNGKLSKMTVNDGEGVKIDGTIQTTKNDITNNSKNNVMYGSTVIPPKGTTPAPSGGGGSSTGGSKPAATSFTPVVNGEGENVTGTVKYVVNGKETTTLKSGDSVTMTVTPPDGYVVTSVACDETVVTDNGNNTYSFTVPTGATKLTLTVTYATASVAAATNATDFVYNAQTKGAAAMSDDSKTLGSTVTVILDGSTPHKDNVVLDLKGATVTDLTIRATDDIKKITIEGKYAGTDEVPYQIKSLTIDAPKATVINNATTGTANIESVDPKNSYHPNRNHNSLVVRGPAKINVPAKNASDPAAFNPDVTPVTIATNGKDETVTLGGSVKNVSVEAGSKGTISLAEDVATEPAITSASTDVSVNAGSKPVNLAGMFNKVETSSVVTLTNALITLFKPSDGGNAKLAAIQDENGNDVDNKSNITTFDATSFISGVSIDVKADKVDVGTNANIQLGKNADITSLMYSGTTDLNIGKVGGTTGETGGTIQSVDISVSVSVEINVKIGQGVYATQVATVGITTNVTVKAWETDDNGNETPKPVVKKAPALTLKTVDNPNGQLELVPPTGISEPATLNGTKNAYYYKVVGDSAEVEPTQCDEGSTKLTTGKTYLVYYKADPDAEEGYTVDGEPATVVVNTPIAVNSATISGSAICGQTLTAVANNDASGSLTYKWEYGEDNNWTEIVNGTTTGCTLDGNKLTLSNATSGENALVGHKIKVTIDSIYTKDPGVTSNPTAEPVSADMAAYNKFIKEANALVSMYQTYASSPEEVLDGIDCVDSEAMGKLTTAISNAKSCVGDGDKSEQIDLTKRTPKNVKNAASVLEKAISEFRKNGKFAKGAKTSGAQQDLRDLLTSAGALLKSADSSEQSGLNVSPDKKWVAKDIWDALDTAIKAANPDSTDLEVLKTAYKNVNDAMTAFEGAIKPGATIDRSNLDKQIADAKANLSAVYAVGTLSVADAAVGMNISVKQADASTDVIPSEMYVPAEQWEKYFNALDEAAKVINPENQSKVLEQLDKLSAAAIEFKAEMKPGEKDIVPPILRLVRFADNRYAEEPASTAVIEFRASEACSYTVNVDSEVSKDPTQDQSMASLSEDGEIPIDPNTDVVVDAEGEITNPQTIEKITLTGLKANRDYTVTIVATDATGNTSKGLGVTFAGEYDPNKHDVSVDMKMSDNNATFTAVYEGAYNTPEFKWYTYKVTDDTEPSTVLKTMENNTDGQVNDGWTEVTTGKTTTGKTSTLAVDTTTLEPGVHYYACVVKYTDTKVTPQTTKYIGRTCLTNIASDCTVIFDVDGDVTTEDDQVTVTVPYNTVIKAADIPEAAKPNFKFNGWKNGEATFDITQPVTEKTLTLVADLQDYTPKNVKITATPGAGVTVENGNYIIDPDTENAKVTLTASAEPAVAGTALTYQWQRKSTTSGDNVTWGDIPEATSSTYEVTAANAESGTYEYRCVISAKDKAADTEAIATVNTDPVTITVPDKFTVTIKLGNGEEDITVTVAKGSKTLADVLTAKNVLNPTWTGHVFNGWYEGAAKADLSTSVTADHELVAKWTNYGITEASIKHDSTPLIDNYTITVDTKSGVVLNASINEVDAGVAVAFAWQSTTDNTDATSWKAVDNSLVTTSGSTSTLTLPASTTKGTTYYKCTATTTTKDTDGSKDVTDQVEFHEVTVKVVDSLVTITFNPAEGTTTELTRDIEKDAAIGTLPTPERAGYTFVGWFMPDGTTKVEDTTTFSANTTLTAQWTKIEYAITVNEAGLYKGGVKQNGYEINEDATDWSLKVDVSVNGGATLSYQWSADEAVITGETASSLPMSTAAADRVNKTYKCVVTATANGENVATETLEFPVTYNIDEGSTDVTVTLDFNIGQTPVTKKVASGTTLAAALEGVNFPEKANHVVTGWTKDGVEVDPATATITENCRFVAKWTDYTITVTEANLYKGAAKQSTYEVDPDTDDWTLKVVATPANTADLSYAWSCKTASGDYTLAGDTTSASLKVTTDDLTAKTYTCVITAKVDTDTVATKTVEIPITYKSTGSFTITFDLDGGTATQATIVTVPANTALAAEKIPVPTKTNYTFKGWKLEGDSDPTKVYTKEEIVSAQASVSKDAKYTAQWEAAAGPKITVTKSDFLKGTEKVPATGTSYVVTDDTSDWKLQVEATAENATVTYKWECAYKSGGTYNLTGDTTSGTLAVTKDDFNAKIYTCTIKATDTTDATKTATETVTFDVTYEIAGTVKVTFNLDGGSVGESTAAVELSTDTQGKLAANSIPTPTKAMNKFLGWKLDGTSDAAVQDSAIYSKKFEAAASYTAQWEDYTLNPSIYGTKTDTGITYDDSTKTYTIAADATGTLTLTAAANCAKPDATVTYQWQSKPNGENAGSGIDFTNISGAASPTLATFTTGKYDYRCVITTDAKLSDNTTPVASKETAAITVNKSGNVTITFNLDGGKVGTSTVAIDKTVASGGTIGTGNVPAPTKDGCVFLGWKLNNGGNIIKSETLATQTFTANASYTAAWAKLNTFNATAKVGTSKTLQVTENDSAFDYTITTDTAGETITITVTSVCEGGTATYAWNGATGGADGTATITGNNNATCTCTISVADVKLQEVKFTVKVEEANYTLGVEGKKSTDGSTYNDFDDTVNDNTYDVGSDANVKSLTFAPKLFKNGTADTESTASYAWTQNSTTITTTASKGISVDNNGTLKINCAASDFENLSSAAFTCTATIGGKNVVANITVTANKVTTTEPETSDYYISVDTSNDVYAIAGDAATYVLADDSKSVQLKLSDSAAVTKWLSSTNGTDYTALKGDGGSSDATGNTYAVKADALSQPLYIKATIGSASDAKDTVPVIVKLGAEVNVVSGGTGAWVNNAYTVTKDSESLKLGVVPSTELGSLDSSNGVTYATSSDGSSYGTATAVTASSGKYEFTVSDAANVTSVKIIVTYDTSGTKKYVTRIIKVNKASNP